MFEDEAVDEVAEGVAFVGVEAAGGFELEPQVVGAFLAAMAFPQRLVELRKQQGLTQQALADRADIHVTLLRRYEAGKTRPGLDALRKIAVALHVSADLLLFRVTGTSSDAAL